MSSFVRFNLPLRLAHLTGRRYRRRRRRHRQAGQVVWPLRPCRPDVFAWRQPDAALVGPNIRRPTLAAHANGHACRIDLGPLARLAVSKNDLHLGGAISPGLLERNEKLLNQCRAASRARSPLSRPLTLDSGLWAAGQRAEKRRPRPAGRPAEAKLRRRHGSWHGPGSRGQAARRTERNHRQAAGGPSNFAFSLSVCRRKQVQFFF